jgi:hypothetical protein
MDLRLGQAGSTLRTFLEDELSETHLGLTSGARQHLERFRSFLLAFYTTKLGYYPPASIDARGTIFEPETYRTMHDDFEALYELLVDGSFTSAESTPFLAQGGICTVQSVHSFDLRYRYKSLDHPLPLLPEVSSAHNSRRMSFLATISGGAGKLRPDQRLVAHAALVKAQNQWKRAVLQNDLVRAYRRFEEESIVSPNRADRNEKVNLVDARKVRWILVYAIYQTLRNAVTAPAEVRDIDDLDYSVAISTADLPPWKEDRSVGGASVRSLVRRQTEMSMMTRSPSTSTSGWNSAETTPSQLGRTKLKPDIDYFALTHRPTGLDISPRPRPPISMQNSPSVPPRSRSLTRSLSRNNAFRRSLSLFRREPPAPEAPPARKPGYHEIVVHGYGNGTNEVSHTPPPIEGPVAPDSPKSTANRSNSTASNSSAQTDGRSAGSEAGTAESSAPPTSPKGEDFSALGIAQGETEAERQAEDDDEDPPTPDIPPRGRRREVVSYFLPSGSRSQPIITPARPGSSGQTGVMDASLRKGRGYAASYESLVQRQEEALVMAELSPSPLRIKKDESRRLPNDADVLDGGEFDMDKGRGIDAILGDEEVMNEWENYPGLGGHTFFVPGVVEV